MYGPANDTRIQLKRTHLTPNPFRYRQASTVLRVRPKCSSNNDNRVNSRGTAGLTEAEAQVEANG